MQPPLKVFVVDDEFQSRNLLCNLLQNNFENISIAGQAGTLKDAAEGIAQHKPDLLFLDIELGTESAFDLLQQFDHLNSRIVFVTAHDEYALKAFRFNAIDYLLKPIILGELERAIQKASSHKADNGITYNEQLSNLIHSIHHKKNVHDKIAVPTSEGFILVPVNEIVFCRASGNYTEFHLVNNKQLLSSYTLKQYHDLLADHNFFRTHRSYLINLSQVKMYRKGDGGTAVMQDGSEIEISKQNKEAFLQYFKA